MKAATTVYAISFEVRVIDGKNGGHLLALCQIHKCGVGEVHRAVRIADHESLHCGEFHVFNCGHGDSTGAQEFPRGFPFTAGFADKVKQLRKNGFEVIRGIRSCGNASTQTRCQQSLLSSRAMIAPVSIKALAAITLPQTPAHFLAYVLGTMRIRAFKCTKKQANAAFCIRFCSSSPSP